VKLGEILSTGDIVIGVCGADIADVASQLLRRTLPDHGIAAADIERIVHSVTAREREMATTCGHSALPHARDTAINEFIATIAINRDGVVKGKPEPRVVIAFVSPESKRNEHLTFLASLSRLVSDAKAMNAIASATTPEEALQTLLHR